MGVIETKIVKKKRGQNAAWTVMDKYLTKTTAPSC